MCGRPVRYCYFTTTNRTFLFPHSVFAAARGHLMHILTSFHIRYTFPILIQFLDFPVYLTTLDFQPFRLCASQFIQLYIFWLILSSYIASSSCISKLTLGRFQLISRLDVRHLRCCKVSSRFDSCAFPLLSS